MPCCEFMGMCVAILECQIDFKSKPSKINENWLIILNHHHKTLILAFERVIATTATVSSMNCKKGNTYTLK